MKKRVAKIICGLLAIQLAFGQSMIFVSAENTNTQDNAIESLVDTLEAEQSSTDSQESQSNVVDSNAGSQETDNSSQVNESEKVDVKGSIEVTLLHTLKIAKTQKFDIVLKDKKTETVYLNNSNVNSSEYKDRDTIVFDNLDTGDYDIQIKSDKFVTYTQTIHVTNYVSKIYVSTGKASIDGYGTMLYGDVNNDNQVDQKDANEVIEQLQVASKKSRFDLNQDGQVDLIDLQYVSLKIGEKQILSNVETTIPNNIVSLEQGDNTKVSGSIEDLQSGKSIEISVVDGTISEEKPLEFSLNLATAKTPLEVEGINIQMPIDNTISETTITVEYIDQDGAVQKMDIPFVTSKMRSISNKAFAQSNPDGSISIHLGGKVAVKKVSFKVTATTSPNASLVEITKVEFVNDMENKIPEPELNIPTIKSIQPGNKEITLSWSKETNVTGYEVSITLNGVTKYVKTNDTKITISQFGNEKLQNKKTYTLRVRSINGDWKSQFSQAVTATPKYDSQPDAPDKLTLKADYKKISVTWQAPKDDSADEYTLYYKKESDSSYKKVSNIKDTKYELYNLDDQTTYLIYVTASNDYGEGPKSLEASATTTSLKPVIMSKYNLINTSNGEGELTNHIVSASIGTGWMVESTLDTKSSSALGLFDDDYSSYWQTNTWDTGGYNQWSNQGISVTFDKEYTIDEIRVAEHQDQADFPYIKLYYKDENNRLQTMNLDWNYSKEKDANGRMHYRIKLTKPITVSSLTIGLARYQTTSPSIQVAEVKFYEYDSLEDDIQNLYADNLHLSIRSDIQESDFENLQKRLDTKVNGDYHPDRDILQKELNEAKVLFDDQTSLDDIYHVSSDISASYDSQLKTGGLNGWQPLGISAKAGEKLVIYVGKDGAKSGTNTQLKIIATQQHAESSQLSKEIATLKIGRNEIQIPELTSTNVEKGGALYVQYTGSNKADDYALRVSGGHKIPVLNLHGINDATKRRELINIYINELTEYVSTLQKEHDEDHATKFLFFTLNGYDEKTCIYNTTDILFDGMMFSLPATQVLAGLGNNPETHLENTISSMESMLKIFYQNKGLTNDFAEGTSEELKKQNRLPSQHLNIRYMKMFSGAFMYAAGNHVGIEWDQTRSLILSEKVQVDDSGKITQGQYFGWGIAHEIGHQLNQSDYTIAEVTNNYFSLLATANGTNSGVRFSYDAIYDKVTSGAVGHSSDVFTSLAMYWQLHLAYDNAYAQKTYKNYQEITENLLFARVDSYARNPSSFKGKVELTLNAGTDQNLMRLVSAAAKKDLTEFFTRWGYVPNQETSEFMGQFEKETRAIYYINDDAQSAVIEKLTTSFKDKKVISSVDVMVDNSNVTLTMQTNSLYDQDILGYEVVRVTTIQGQTQKEVVGFTTTNTFTDSVNIGSRAISYEVYAVGKDTHRSSVYNTHTHKIYSDGNQDKTQMTVSTNMISSLDQNHESNENMPCETVKIHAIDMVLDNQKEKEYVGKAESDPTITIDLKQNLDISALRYYAKTSPIKDYKIEVSVDNKNYSTVRMGTFDLKNNQETIYFAGDNGEGKWNQAYNARYIRITALNQKNKDISILEFDILGPSGDNVELMNDNETPAIGKLAHDYVYETSTSAKIPAGSIVFTGEYKGNPAYNVVVLYDENGKIVGGLDDEGSINAESIILAPDPGDGLLGETSEGTWIYWISPEYAKNLPSKVRAELYRVDNAQTNEGQRLVSDTIFVDVSKNLPSISFEK